MPGDKQKNKTPSALILSEGFFMADTFDFDYFEIGVPLDLAKTLNPSMSIAVVLPGLPSAICRESAQTTGITSAAVPVRKHSSAV